MLKKIITPKEEIQFRKDGFDNKYLINEGSKSLGMFAICHNQEIPAQISSQEVGFYIIEGKMDIVLDDKIFNLTEGQLLIVPKQTAYTLKIIENTKFLSFRM